MEFPDEVLTTLLKHATIRRANFYQSMSMHEQGTDDWQRFREEYDKLSDAVSFLEQVQSARVEAA